MKLKKTMSMMKTKNQTTNLHSKPTQKGVTMNIKRLLVAMIAMLFAVSATFAITEAGTPISNQAFGNYYDAAGNQMDQVASNIITTEVAHLGGVTVSVNGSSTLPMDGAGVATFSVTVTNTGNYAESFSLSDVLTVATGGSSIPSDYTVTLLNGASEAITSTGILAYGNGSITLSVLVESNATPNGDDASDQLSIVVTATSTNVSYPVISDDATLTVNIEIPALTLTKTVDPSGAQPPGTVLTYQIVVLNTGNGSSSSVVITDGIPTNTTYQPGSLTIDGSGKSDADDGDGATCDGTTSTFSFETLGVGASTTVTLQVAID